MQLKVSAPGIDLKDGEREQIDRDLEKLDRRLKDRDQVFGEVRITDSNSAAHGFNVVLEVRYGRNHLIAKAANTDLGMAVREAREDVLRQINDRSRRGHSSFSKGL